MPLLTELSGVFEIKSKGRSFATFSKVINLPVMCSDIKLIFYIFCLYTILNIKFQESFVSLILNNMQEPTRGRSCPNEYR